jgi:hypothetical protein
MKQGEKYEKIKKKLEESNYAIEDVDKENILATLMK